MNSLSLFFIGAVLAISLHKGLASDSELNGYVTNKQISDALDEFKKLLENNVPEEYMTEKYFLLNYLRKRKYDVASAYQNILKYVQWRRNEGIENILDENWETMRVRFPFSLDSVDIDGRPILYWELRHWDIASYVSIEGNDEEDGNELTKHLVHYLVMISEETEELLRDIRASGNNITTYRHIINAAGFSIEKHACHKCLQVYHAMAEISAFFPSNMEKPVILNVSSPFKTVLSLFRAYTSDVVLYGRDRNAWLDVLLEDIDTEELPESLLNYYEFDTDDK